MSISEATQREIAELRKETERIRVAIRELRNKETRWREVAAELARRQFDKSELEVIEKLFVFGSLEDIEEALGIEVK